MTFLGPTSNKLQQNCFHRTKAIISVLNNILKVPKITLVEHAKIEILKLLTFTTGSPSLKKIKIPEITRNLGTSSYQKCLVHQRYCSL